MIHKYRLFDYNIILDVNSGAVHLADDCAFVLLDHITEIMPKECPSEAIQTLRGEYTVAEIKEAYSELLALHEEGTLFSKDDCEPFSRLLENAPIKSMCLNIAHDCNLRCGYCFASQGDFGQGRKLMPFEVAKAAIDYLIEYSGKRINLELDFFGGEPLLNFETVKETVEYARSREEETGKRFRFTLTTNGLLLTDDVIDFINREMSNVVLSIDGRPEVHDKLRQRVGGSGSYDSIVPKYKKLISQRQGKEYYVRGTYTKLNLDFYNDVLHLLELGFDQISVEPVLSAEGFPYVISEEDISAVFESYEVLARKLIEKKRRGEGFNFFHFMIDLNGGPCAVKRLRGCSCGNEYIAVTPDGDIYPCHQFVGQDNWIMGSVMQGTIDNEMKSTFSKANIYAKDTCKECWARFYCSGGCNAGNAQINGSILEPYSLSCAIEKKRLECAIAVKAALSGG